ncbi:MAG: leucine-rich repeat protein, partial [Holosporales bacterium]|nr:leucine-rich repeat protein [Holosporales bacterium]
DVEENKRNILDNIFSDTDRQVSVAGDCHAFFPDNTVYRRHGNAWISLTSIADKQTFDYFVDHKEDCKEFLREVVWSSDIAEEIPDGVFGSCPNLFKVVLKDVKKIGENAFAGCKSLEEVVIPESVTSIGTNAFTGCRALMELTIPESVTSIGTDAFVDCWSLLELTIPKSVTSIEPGAFAATGLNVVHLKSQNINGVDFTQPGNGIVYVLNSIFSNSIALGAPKATKGCRVVLADGNEYMFTKCGWRPTTKVTFERQEDIEMFRACCRTHRDTTTKLREVVWDNPGEIPAKLFDRCTKLWKIYFKEGDIKKRALAEYPDLKEITISESVRCCEGAFCGTRLRDIHFESWRSGNGSYDETAAINFLNGVFFDSKTNTVTAPEGCVAHFPLGHVCTCTKAGWESARDMTTLRIDNETDVMWLSAHRKRFPGAANVLREVEWSFAQIPAGIFSGGQNLRTVSLSRGVEDIGERAFANCVSLSELEIPASVHTIGRGAFCGTGINDLKFAASTINGQTLGTNVAATIAFLDDIFSDTDGNVGAEIGCTVHFPHTRYVRYEDTWELRFHVDGRGEIRPDVVFGKNQVEQLSDPQNFVVANNITEIGKGAFDESGIRSVSFEENSRLETIGEYAFRGCEQLTSVELPPTVFVIYPFAFCGCTALQKIVIPKNVKFVCHGAFYGSGIQEIRFLSFPKVYIEDNPEDGVEKHKKHFLTRIFSASETEADLLNDGVRAYFPDGTIYWYVDGEWLSGRHGAPPQQLRVFFPRSPTEPEPIQFQQRSQMPGWPEPAPEQDATPNPPQSLTMKRSETIDWSAFVTPSQTPALKRSSVTFSAFASSQSQTPAKQPSQAPKDASAASPNPPQTSALRRSPGINLSAFVASLQTPDPAKQPSQAPKNAQDTFPSPPQPSADATRCWNDHGVDSVHLNDDFDGAT